MIDRIVQHAAALGLAVVVTVSGLAGMNALADQQYVDAVAASAPLQSVVIVGQRPARG
jgi:hypothetical protein